MEVEVGRKPHGYVAGDDDNEYDDLEGINYPRTQPRTGTGAKGDNSADPDTGVVARQGEAVVEWAEGMRLHLYSKNKTGYAGVYQESRCTRFSARFKGKNLGGFAT